MSDSVEIEDTQRGDAPSEPSTGDAVDERSPRRRRRVGWLIAAAVVLVVAAVLIAAGVSGNDAPDVARSTELSTVAVSRTDLVVTEDLAGTLGFGEAEPLTFRSSSEGVDTINGLVDGTVTGVAQLNSTVASGDILYSVNLEPIVVLQGDLPAYRSFTSGMSDGPDVAQLEQALVGLGYDPDGDITIDEDFTSATANAIERLQEAVGADHTGRLDLGYVIFASHPIYVSTLHLGVGDPARAGEPIVSTSSAISGTVTTIVAEGSIVGQGGELLTIDRQPVVLLLGSVPAYRALDRGASGVDVEQLQGALIALGHGAGTDITASGVFDDATFDAVVAWQTSVGATPDGVVNVGDVFFLPAPIRIGENLVAVGDAARDGTPILSSSVSATFVSVQLSTDDQDLVAVGDQVVVELPAGVREPAVVSDIGTVVFVTQQGDTYFEMNVTLDDPSAAEGLDEAPVDVEVVSDRADGVLSVPVTALLALAEGGYAVEVVPSSGDVFLVAVDPGLFADGFVEVTSAGLEAGMEVVVP